MAEHNISRPRTACEITSERVVAGCSSEGAQVQAATVSPVADGAVLPSLQPGNVVAREAVVTAVREALAGLGGRSKDVCLIIPDATTRIVLLEFDTLPPKPQEADAVVRFRLKKSLPFDVEESAVSFDRQGTSVPVHVVAAVTPRAVLEEYESAVRDAGYNPGTVLPSTVAALGLVDAARPTMLIKVERGTTTFTIADQKQLLLYRALENGGSRVTGDSLLDDVNTSLVYFEDRYSVGVNRVLVSGVESVSALQGALAPANIAVEELVSSSTAGGAAGSVPRNVLAAVAGALGS